MLMKMKWNQGEVNIIAMDGRARKIWEEYWVFGCRVSRGKWRKREQIRVLQNNGTI